MARFDIDADEHVGQIHRQLRQGRYQPGPYRAWTIRDPKLRLIAAPSMPDRVVQRALIDDIAPAFERAFIVHSYAVAAGRGPQRAILTYLRWLRQYRYRVSLDIRRYFVSIDHDILLGLFAQRLRDRRTLELIQSMIAVGGHVYETERAVRALGLDREPIRPGCGIPLGGYLSHWSGGLYLDAFDHHVKRVLGIRGYLRYMDDFTLFADEPAQLVEARAAIVEWLARERRLQLKPRHDPILPASQPATYLGYRVGRAGVLPGPKAKRRLYRRLLTAEDLGPER
ncbi:MAG: reverse transcriptase domain-containing protein, partial [Myxococcota bacterium]